jgi:hypothetical protein
MGYDILIAYKERERAALLRLASEVVEVGESRGCPLSPGEDAMVVELVRQAQALEHEISRLQIDQRRAMLSKHGEGEDI